MYYVDLGKVLTLAFWKQWVLFTVLTEWMFCILVSAENLEKSLKHMERQLQQLEKDLKTFPVPEDKHDKFVAKMSISLKALLKKQSKLKIPK